MRVDKARALSPVGWPVESGIFIFILNLQFREQQIAGLKRAAGPMDRRCTHSIALRCREFDRRSGFLIDENIGERVSVRLPIRVAKCGYEGGRSSVRIHAN